MKRIVGLDALRGLAALGVALYHFTDVYFEHAHALAKVFSWGRYGVNLFFMISGFVIYMTVQKIERPSDFVMSRFARLFPAYWVAVVFTFAVTHLAGASRLQVDSSIGLVNLSMLQGYFGVPTVDTSYWTLQIEMSFYILFFILLSSGRLAWVNPLLLCMMAFAAVDRRLGLLAPIPGSPLGPLRDDLMLPYIHYFAIGIVLFRLGVKREWGRPANHAVLGMGLLMVKMYLPWTGVALHAAFALAIYLVAIGREGLLRWKPLVGLGLISYPFYLIHQFFGYVLLDGLRACGVGANLSILATLAACVPISWAIYRWVERPARAVLLSRYRLAFPKPAPA